MMEASPPTNSSGLHALRSRMTRPSACRTGAQDGDPLRGPARPVPRRPRPDDRRAGAARRSSTELGGNDLYIWVVTIYLLTSTISVPVLRQAVRHLRPQADVHDRHRACSSSARPCPGLSQNMEQLILFRGIQGIGAGALFPIALAVIGDLFTPGRARQVPGPVRRRVRHLVHRRPARRRLPDRATSAGTGSSTSTSRSGSSPVRHLAAPADDQDARADPQLRHPRRGDLHDRDQLPAHRPDQQGPDERDDASLNDWTDPAVGGLIAPGSSASCCSSWSSCGPRSRSSRSTCCGSGPTRPRCCRRSSSASRSSARSSSCRAGSRSSRAFSADELGPRGLAAHGRADRQLDRVGPDRVANRKYKWLIVGGDRRDGLRDCC